MLNKLTVHTFTHPHHSSTLADSDIALGATASFPVGAQDLIKRGMKPGPALGRRLAELEDSWVASDFALTRGALLDG